MNKIMIDFLKKVDMIASVFEERAKELLPKGYSLKIKTRNNAVVGVVLNVPFVFVDLFTLDPNYYSTRIEHKYYANDKYKPVKYWDHARFLEENEKAEELVDVYNSLYFLAEELCPGKWNSVLHCQEYDCWFEIYAKPTRKAIKECGFEYTQYTFNKEKGLMEMVKI